MSKALKSVVTEVGKNTKKSKASISKAKQDLQNQSPGTVIERNALNRTMNKTQNTKREPCQDGSSHSNHKSLCKPPLSVQRSFILHCILHKAPARLDVGAPHEPSCRLPPVSALCASSHNPLQSTLHKQ